MCIIVVSCQHDGSNVGQAERASATMSLQNISPPQAQAGMLMNDAFARAQRQKQHAGSRIRTASLTLEAENARAVLDSVKHIVETLQGSVASESESLSDNSVIIQVTVRLPSEHLETAIERFSAQAVRMVRKSITTEDVGEQIVDLDARLKTKREVETRYRDLLKQAKTVQEILAVEKQLNIMREEVESQQGRLAYLNNRVAKSTINVTITKEQLAANKREDFGKRILSAFVNSWENLQTAIILFINVLPVTLLAGGLCLLVWRLWKKYRIRLQSRIKPVTPNS